MFTEPPAPPLNEPTEILEVNSKFSKLIGVFKPPEGVTAILVTSVNLGTGYLFLLSKCYLIKIPVDTLVRAGT